MNVHRTTGAFVIALCAVYPSPTRAQDLAQDISPFVPPPCVAGQEMFTDVPASNPFCPWIEQLVRDHITGGCGPQLYCPTSSVTRAQMAVFLELAMRGTDTYTVDAGLLDGMDSTDFVSAVNAGTGLSGGGGGGTVTLSLADSFRLPQTCTGGQHPEWTGTAWECGSPGAGTVTSVGTGAGLSGGPITTTGTISVAPGGITSAMVADGTIGSADVADGSIAAADVASAQVQLRVAPPCAPGEFVRAVNVDGTPVCAADADSGGTVTSVDTGAGLSGGPITGAGTVSVAPGGITGGMIAADSVGSAHVADGSIGTADVTDGSIGTADIADGGVGAADVASAQVQLRVASPCAPDQSIRVVNADGTVVCETDDDSGGTVSSVATGAGLTGGPITGAGTISVATGGITGAMIADGAVASADIADGSIGAADVNSTQVQRRVSQACTTSQFMRAVNADGSVTCDAEGSHTHFGQSWSGSIAPGYGLTVVNGAGPAMLASTNATAGPAIYATANDSTGSTLGLYAIVNSTSGMAVRGLADATTGSTYGVGGYSVSSSGIGVVGSASSSSGATRGVYGITNSTSGTGVHGSVFASTGQTVGVYGKSESVSGTGVRGEATFLQGGTDPSYGVLGLNHRDLGAGVRGEGPTVGVLGVATGVTTNTSGVKGTVTSTAGEGVRGEATATTGVTRGVFGRANSTLGRGLEGFAPAVSGETYGVHATSVSSAGTAVRAIAAATIGTNYGIVASTASSSGYAGFFSGAVHVAGSLSVSGVKNFKIDHPLDPANRYLVHAAIESSEMLNMYSGTVVLDAAGTATVHLPEWFEALNRDFRYQLTCVGGYAPVYIASEIERGRFGIAGGRPGLKVSWQVVGSRSDAHALSHPMAVEEDKPADERGTYLDPGAHGQPAERGRDYKFTNAGREPLP